MNLRYEQLCSGTPGAEPDSYAVHVPEGKGSLQTSSSLVPGAERLHGWSTSSSWVSSDRNPFQALCDQKHRKEGTTGRLPSEECSWSTPTHPCKSHIITALLFKILLSGVSLCHTLRVPFCFQWDFVIGFTRSTCFIKDLWRLWLQ